MLTVLRNRLVGLGRGEEGVALVVTLGVFMFLYVACASVYAFGMAVKEKMQLQGACDAAAYSAAVVQADTLSRIATINRAMSWTYQQMTRRQMDYIVWQWLEETIEHYRADRNYAESYAKSKNLEYSQVLCEEGVWDQAVGWDIDGDIILNGGKSRKLSDLSALCEGFDDWLSNGTNSVGGSIAESLYTQTGTTFLGDRKSCGLGLQIDDDLQNIHDMSKAVAALADGLPGHVEDAVCGILMANLPSYMTRGDCRYCVKQSDSPRGDYLREFDNSSYDELVFLSMGNKVYESAEEAFGTGIDNWFEFGDSKPAADLVGKGLHRLYNPDRVATTLKATWTWWAKAWKCIRTETTHTHEHMESAETCDHSHDEGMCWCKSAGEGVLVNAVCRANNDNRYDNRFNGTTVNGEIAWAKPLKLRESYFGPKGTITVALARRNENPWFSVFGRVGGGIYSAFSPVSNSWSFCFASAKAGYKLYHVPKDFAIYAHRGDEDSTVYRADWEERYNGTVRVYNGPRDYCVDWKPEGHLLQDWITYYKRDKDGNIVRDSSGRKVKGDVTVYRYTNPSSLDPSWRQSWNLVQDDWDAVMVPVRQGGSLGYEEESYSLADWWHKRIHDYARDKWETIPYRFEPVWKNRDDRYLKSLVEWASWKTLCGDGEPNTDMAAGPRVGDSRDVLGGLLAGNAWEDEWENGLPSPAGTGVSRWNIGKPGKNLDWKKIGAEMYH